MNVTEVIQYFTVDDLSFSSFLAQRDQIQPPILIIETITHQVTVGIFIRNLDMFASDDKFSQNKLSLLPT